MRQRRNFTARERLLLELLRPHIGAAWRRALRLDEQEVQMRRQLAPVRSAPNDFATSIRALQQRLGLTAREAEVLFWLSEGTGSLGVSL